MVFSFPETCKQSRDNDKKLIYELFAGSDQFPVDKHFRAESIIQWCVGPKLLLSLGRRSPSGELPPGIFILLPIKRPYQCFMVNYVVMYNIFLQVHSKTCCDRTKQEMKDSNLTSVNTKQRKNRPATTRISNYKLMYAVRKKKSDAPSIIVFLQGPMKY
jgi:hypothetical protein